MNNTPNSNRKHIGIFGKTNAGKSSLLNAITEQDIAIVSGIPGTTTDSVTKAMELIPFGPVLFIDTAGLDDDSALGKLRVNNTLKEFKRTDFAIFVMDSNSLDLDFYNKQINVLKKYNIPYILVFNKIDTCTHEQVQTLKEKFPNAIMTSVNNRESILLLKETLIKNLQTTEEEPSLIKGLVPYSGTIVMVVPVDSEAPKGRLILPQVQVIRDCLDNGIKSYVVRDTELESALEDLKNIDLVITDSQAFKKVDSILNNRTKLTSFSILFARQKGDLDAFVKGVKTLDNLVDGSKILISESCTHNTSHEDIGKVKIPNLIKKYTAKQINFDFKMGKDFPENLDEYDLIIHCGSCMLNKKIMQNRIKESHENGVPITNYGIVIAYLTGILDKSIEIFS